MNGVLATAGVLIVLFGLVVLGGGVLVWMAPVPADDMTPARDILLNIADWMRKGFGGSNPRVRRLAPCGQKKQRLRNASKPHRVDNRGCQLAYLRAWPNL